MKTTRKNPTLELMASLNTDWLASSTSPDFWGCCFSDEGIKMRINAVVYSVTVTLHGKPKCQVSSSFTVQDGGDDCIKKPDPLYIAYKGEEYNDRDKIDLEFSRKKTYTFSVEGRLENENVEWSHQLESSSKGGFEVKYHKDGDYLSMTIANDVIKEGGWIKVQSLDDADRKVYVDVLMPGPEFVYSDFETADALNDKRVAKEDETLYMVSASGLRTSYTYINESPDAESKDNIPISFLKWHLNGEPQVSQWGDRRFTYGHEVGDDNSISLLTHNGRNTFRNYQNSVEVKAYYQTKYSVIDPAVIKRTEDIFERVDNINDALKRKIRSWDVDFDYSSNLEGRQFNEEDDESRFYYDVRRGSYGGGVSLSFTKNLPPPYSVRFANVVNVGV